MRRQIPRKEWAASDGGKISRVFAGEAEGVTRDDVLDNITLYWLTNTAISSARLYWENKLAYFSPKGVSVPVAVSAFPDELFQCPRNWAARAYPKLIHYNKLDKGGHFPAWEQPQLFSEEVRAGFRPLRSASELRGELAVRSSRRASDDRGSPVSTPGN